MQIYRLVRARYLADFSGEGAAIMGNRWNSKGTKMIYCAANRSLAMAEVAVHLSLNNLPKDYLMMEIEVPSDVRIDELNSLPDNWHAFPATSATKLIGDQFILQDVSCLLKVPSAIVHKDYNFLINPNHKEFTKIRILDTYPFPFDLRLFGSYK
jgi:RES domain-containing protein